MRLRKISSPILLLSPSVISLILFCLTRSQQLTWSNYANDSGDFLAAILSKGVPHPTGYPTYLLWTAFLQRLPVGDVYFRSVLASMLPVAISGGILALICWQFLITHKNWPGLVLSMMAGLFWSLSPFLWSQAIIVEVQGLQAIFIILALWWCLILYDGMQSSRNRTWLPVLSLCFGLGLGNHITLAFFLPALSAGYLLAHQRGLGLAKILTHAGLVGLGLLVYLIIPFRAVANPPINWGDGSTWQGFWWLVSGQVYQPLLVESNFATLGNRLSALALIIRNQFGIPAVLLSVYALVQVQFPNRVTRWLFIYLFSVYALFAMLYATDDSIVYLLTSLLMVVLWMVQGLDHLLSWSWRSMPSGFSLAALILILFIFKLPTTFQEVNLSRENDAARFATQLLEALPEQAILLTSSDPDSFPLWYYHFGLGQRSDMTLVTLPLTQFRWYQQSLVATYPDVRFPAIIPEFGNHLQTWGTLVPEMNPERVTCRSSTGHDQEFLIETVCTDNTVIRFTMPLD